MESLKADKTLSTINVTHLQDQFQFIEKVCLQFIKQRK